MTCGVGYDAAVSLDQEGDLGAEAGNEEPQPSTAESISEPASEQASENEGIIVLGVADERPFSVTAERLAEGRAAITFNLGGNIIVVQCNSQQASKFLMQSISQLSSLFT